MNSRLALLCACGHAVLASEFIFSEDFSAPTYSPTWKETSVKDFGSCSYIAELLHEQPSLKQKKFLLSAGDNSINAKKERGLYASNENAYYALSSEFKEPISAKEATSVSLGFTLKFDSPEQIECTEVAVQALKHLGIKNYQYCPNDGVALSLGVEMCGHLFRVNAFINFDGQSFKLKRHISLTDFFPTIDYSQNHPRETQYDSHTLAIELRADNTYSIVADGRPKAEGSILEDFGLIRNDLSLVDFDLSETVLPESLSIQEIESADSIFDENIMENLAQWHTFLLEQSELTPVAQDEAYSFLDKPLITSSEVFGSAQSIWGVGVWARESGLTARPLIDDIKFKVDY